MDKNYKLFHPKTIDGEVCLPMKELDTWLMTLDVNEILDIEKRELIAEYQDLNYKLLSDFRNNGFILKTEKEHNLRQKVYKMLGLGGQE